LIEIKKSEKTLYHLFDQTTSYENYMKREEEWLFVNEEIKTFFKVYLISDEEARLIE
jgi:putative heme iron utilization protein